MRKRLSIEKVEPFRTRVHGDQGHALRDCLAKWSTRVGVDAGKDWPELPPGIEDRKAEIWEPLIAVADQAGGHWPDTARNACLELTAAADTRRVSLGVTLLTDLREIFDGADVLSTETILERLCGIKSYRTDEQGEPMFIAEDAPWAELHGKPLDSRRLARMLSDYDVSSTKIKYEGRSLRGYRQTDLWEAWDRYLPPTLRKAEPAEPTEPPGQPFGAPDDLVSKENVRAPAPSTKMEPPNLSPRKEGSASSASSGLLRTGSGESVREVEL